MRIKKLWLVTIAALWCSITVSAHDFEVNGIYYNFTSSSTVEVTHKGNAWDSYSNEYSGAVTIPSTVTYNGKTYNVTRIGESAFDTCSGLTSITIPESVTSIGDYAFYDCSSLKLLVCLALTPPYLGDYVFDGEQGEVKPFLSVPVESIADYSEADGWSSLPSTNTTILYISTSRGSWAIEKGGDRLKSNRDINAQATAEDSQQQFAIISHIDEDGEVSYYLYHPAEKKFVNIDGSLSDTPTYPIYFKAGAYENTLVAYFDESHYININGERQMVINSWDDADAGNSCTIVAVEEYDLTEALDLFPFVLDGYSYWKTSADEVKLVSASQALNKLEIPATIMFKGKNYSVTSIGDYAFESCSSLTSVIIPESVTSIGGWAFRSCNSLTSITIPKSVTSIGDAVFQHCSNLTAITIPEGVTSIGSSAFSVCCNLTSITIPKSVKSIGDYAFEGCSSLTSITIPEGVTSIGDYAFEGCSSLTSAIISEGVKTIGSWAFRDCSSLTSITIPESVTNIGEGVFQRCSILASLVVKEGNTTYDSRDNCNAIIETNSNMLIYGCSSTVIPPECDEH